MLEDVPGLAAYACSTCRSQKRKCTKELPACALCRKYDRPCNYSTQPPASTGPPLSEDDVSEKTLALVAGQPDPETAFPASFFLDHEFFQAAGHSTPQSTFKLPPGVANSLLSEEQAHYDVDIYFNSVHTILPFVSRTRLNQDLSNLQNGLGADTALLLMAMQLHTQSPCETEPRDWPKYHSAKESISGIEARNIFSIRLVQAAILVAYYELAHAIFPAAYLSIGHCARLSHAIGLHDRKRAPQMLPNPKSQTEQEERRRVWWVVSILDRFVTIGIPASPPASEGMRPDEFLPIDEQSWDGGQLIAGQPLAISTAVAHQMSPFARTCQSSHLLSRVLRHRDDDYTDMDMDADFRYEEALQLHITVNALYVAVTQYAEHLVASFSDISNHTSHFTATALCLSALLSLYDIYACIESAPVERLRNTKFLEMHRISLVGLQTASNAAHRFAMSVQEIVTAAGQEGLLKTSPLICDCLYQATTFYLWQLKEVPSNEHTGKVTDISTVLQTLGTRWKSPSKSLSKVLLEWLLIRGL
ncbi:hypothetical protein F5X68DRAFT_145908 [Plectosphaerella plurivora]|uniref:Zn(2)-C6 fungal-type domain-containing protein n=1 Tax=Plectosphaerella plurivora TaxID=936078 RepID=A0A9P8UTC4_9PEZI|nr:hypothetical protein F5X68DRAFT_145908 [Plectosphaerella plurivora]